MIPACGSSTSGRSWWCSIAWLEDFTMSSQEELQQNFVMMAYLNEIKQMSKVKQPQNTLLVVVGVYQYDS